MWLLVKSSYSGTQLAFMQAMSLTGPGHSLAYMEASLATTCVYLQNNIHETVNFCMSKENEGPAAQAPIVNYKTIQPTLSLEMLKCAYGPSQGSLPHAIAAFHRSCSL